MTLCTIKVRNAADVPLVFFEFAGDDWNAVPSHETTIRPGEDTGSLFQISVPGLFESSRWGWLYFGFEIPGFGPKMFLVFVEISGLSLFDKFGGGPCANTKSSSRANPFPLGQFGMTRKDADYNQMQITIFTKDLLSTELSPENWMDDLVRLRPSVLDWPISRFKYPGQHDAGSFGNKQHSDYTTAWSWQCNDKNFYEQACSGVRWFDLRLCKIDHYYWPFHGYSTQTGDPLTWGSGPRTVSARAEDTIIGQILRFMEEQPNELLMIQVNFRGGTPVDEAWCTVFKYLGDHLIQLPTQGEIPNLRSIRGQSRRLIVFSDHHRWPPAEENAWIMQYIWDYRNRDIWRGTVWNQQDWDRHDMSLVVHATENWMLRNIEPSGPYVFWWAQCQLTPSFMHPDYFFYPSRSPKALARDANPYTREHITNRGLYRQNGSILSLDWASSDTNIAIAAMNLDNSGTGSWDRWSASDCIGKSYPTTSPTHPSRIPTNPFRTDSPPSSAKTTRVINFVNSSEESLVEKGRFKNIEATKGKKKSLFRCW